jgi:tetratricopeptide (TPR) repeat protein
MDAALTDGELDPSLDALAELAASDPERARKEAITRAGVAQGAEQIALLAVAAEASIRVGTISDALTLFRRAADLAERRSDEQSGPLRVRVAAMLAASGDSELALRTLEAAEPLLGESAWLAWHQRGLILHWAGRSEEALVWLRRAEPAAEGAGDRLTVAKLVMTRALAYAHVGDFEAAAADAVDAEMRCREVGELTLAAHFLHNRGWIAARAGDLAEGWRLMHDAASQPSWTAPPVVLADRAELAHAAGLLSEAADLAEEAWAAQRAVGDDHGAASTSLLRARIALDLGDTEAALDLTATSAAALAAQGRLSLCGAAAGIEVAARREIVEQLGDAERVHAAQATMDAMSSALASVEAHSWRSVRLDGLIAAGEIALLAGHREEAERLFRRAEHDRRDSTRSDVHHHVAAALAHRAKTGTFDDLRLEAAWEEHEARRAMQSVYELRGDWGASTRLLTRVALSPLLDRGDAEGAIRWLERLRRLSSPSHDERLLQTAAALRAVWLRRREAGHDPDADDALLDDEESALEAELVGRARLASSAQPQRVPPAATELAAELGGTQLEWIVALPVGAWTIKLTRDEARVTKIDRDRLQRDATRLASNMRLGRSDWQQAAGDLDATLALDPSTDPVVVIPVGSAVEDVSFGALPSLTRTRLRVCWSGAHWMSTRVDRKVQRVTIAATGVEGSSREVELLSQVWPEATTLRGSAVTSADILAALAADDLVHVGAHGHLRRDNPMLSTLECADGPLYGYELARSARVASTVLLWSCALGGARMPADVGVAGWPTLLSQLGCNALIAAPGALPSAPAPDLAVEVHRGLARGEPTDAILSRVRLLAVSDDLASRAAAMLAVHGAG